MKKFENYVANLNVLKRANEENLENDFIVGGIIDKFFIQFELGWKVLKELLRYEGPAQVEGPQGVLPQPEKDLERPSSTRLEARFPYCREPAYCILSAYCILHIECSTFHSIIFQDLE